MNVEEASALVIAEVLERHGEEDPWRELAMGRLTAEQVVAMREEHESPSEIRSKIALFLPASARVEARSLEQLLEQYFTEDSGRDGAESSHPSTDGPGEGSFARGTVVWTSVLAFAAALALLWLGRGVEGTQREALPRFVVELEGDGAAEQLSATSAGSRATDECAQYYRTDQALSLRLRPSRDVEEDISLAVFVDPEGGEGRWLEDLTKPEQSHSGTIELRLPVEDAGLEPGTWQLTFYLSRSGEHPREAGLRHLAVGAHPGVTVESVTICVVE